MAAGRCRWPFGYRTPGPVSEHRSVYLAGVADLTPVEGRLFAVLEQGAAGPLADGRAELVVTTQRAFWDLPQVEEGTRMIGLVPAVDGAWRIGVLHGEVVDDYKGWHLFVGDGPHFEFWEGSETDYQETLQIVRAVVQGNCRHWWTQEQMRGLLRPWRTFAYWVHHAEVVLPGDVVHASYQGAGVTPEEPDPREVRATPY